MAKKPNENQTRWLKRIAQSRLMKTRTPDEPEPLYSLQNGATVPAPVAQVLIRNGWVKSCGDGFLGDNQTYEVLTP